MKSNNSLKDLTFVVILLENKNKNVVKFVRRLLKSGLANVISWITLTTWSGFHCFNYMRIKAHECFYCFLRLWFHIMDFAQNLWVDYNYLLFMENTHRHGRWPNKEKWLTLLRINLNFSLGFRKQTWQLVGLNMRFSPTSSQVASEN